MSCLGLKVGYFVTPTVKLPAHRAGLPGNVDMITGSAFLPAPAYLQEGGASSRLAREESLMTEAYRVRYKNKIFSNEKVEVDGKSFIHCEFEHCIIVVETGDTQLSGCHFKHCQLMLRGNAYKIAKIITFFSGKSPLKVLDFEEPLFEKAVGDPDEKQTKGGK